MKVRFIGGAFGRMTPPDWFRTILVEALVRRLSKLTDEELARFLDACKWDTWKLYGAEEDA